jgi:hypothetical protein
MAASVEKALSELERIYSTLDDLNPRTFSAEERDAFWKDFAKGLAKSRGLKEWRVGHVIDFGEALDEIRGWVDDGSDVEEEYGLKASDLEADVKLLKSLFAKYDIYDRVLHPNAYINRERDWTRSNKPFLSVIPRWLKPIMIENDIHVEEGLGGVYFKKGDGMGGEISPEFEEVVDLMNWAKSNKSKLASDRSRTASAFDDFGKQLKALRKLALDMRVTLREGGMESEADSLYLSMSDSVRDATKVFRRMR